MKRNTIAALLALTVFVNSVSTFSASELISQDDHIQADGMWNMQESSMESPASDSDPIALEDAESDRPSADDAEVFFNNDSVADDEEDPSIWFLFEFRMQKTLI